MRPLTSKATEIFFHLIQDLNVIGNRRKIGREVSVVNTNMPVTVTCIDVMAEGKVYSVAHFFMHNNELCSDPEMKFLVGDRVSPGSGRTTTAVFPLSLAISGANFVQESVQVNHGKIKDFDRSLQASQALFAGMWMNNILTQQPGYFKDFEPGQLSDSYLCDGEEDYKAS